MEKIHRQYRFKFYLNMNHFIIIEDKPGEVHPHTWEIVISVVSDEEQMTPFANIERKMEEIMEKYQDKLLNECEPFDTIVPTVENAARYFFRLIQDSLVEAGWILIMLEVSETPTRSYVINALLEESSIWEENEKDSLEESAPEVKIAGGRIIAEDIAGSSKEKKEKKAEKSSKKKNKKKKSKKKNKTSKKDKKKRNKKEMKKTLKLLKEIEKWK